VQLLVSVRDADEAREAQAAGADILDAKEPAHGALAPVVPAVLDAIAAELSPGARLSVALGEPADAGALAACLAARAAVMRAHAAFLKFVPPALAIEPLAELVACGRRAAPRARVIVAGYADRLPPTELGAFAHAVAAAGADGLLLDTAAKDTSLLARRTIAELESFVATAHAHGLLVALAGSLALADLPRLAALGVDVAGVRGAACDGGRAGRLSAARVRRLLRAARTPAAPAPAAPRW
jgi:uncharacterized protein (UPF0264 family)